MQILAAPATFAYEIKQSKFIAHLVPYGRFGQHLQDLKSQHPKARHFVTAYRYLNAFGQIVEGSSDDGEPKGTSGKPSLAVLAGNDIIDAAVITVRYFGGTKLGTGGLVRAYTQAVAGAVAGAEFSEYIPTERVEFICGYSDIPRVKYLLETYGIADAEPAFGTLDVQWRVTAGSEALKNFFAAAGRLVSKK
jgi:uncharacterized YigZ family protein